MSTALNAFGLRPVSHPSGVIRPRVLVNAIPDGYGTAIYAQQPVRLLTSGYLAPISATNQAYIGTFMGCEYVDAATGRPVVSQQWVASTSIQSGTTVTAYFTQDPDITYEAMADGSLSQSDLGAGTDFTNITSGDSIIGESRATLGSTTSNAGTHQFHITDVAPYPDNAWGDTYTIVRGIIGNHQFDRASTAF